MNSKIPVVIIVLLVGVSVFAWTTNHTSVNTATSTISSTTTGTVATSTGDTTEIKESGIRGIITIGPTCPVMRFPPEPECNDKSFQATIAVTQNNKLIKTFSSDVNGRFYTALNPGTYVLKKAGEEARLPSFGPQTVIVEPNKITEIDLQFDSGIR